MVASTARQRCARLPTAAIYGTASSSPTSPRLSLRATDPAGSAVPADTALGRPHGRHPECNHVQLSHGRTGQCWDNALAESFFGSIKGELLDLQSWPTRSSARRAVTEYIGWYNGTRLHSTLGYLSPAEYEASHRNEIKNVA
jgi:transposase InsO family protein